MPETVVRFMTIYEGFLRAMAKPQFYLSEARRTKAKDTAPSRLTQINTIAK